MDVITEVLGTLAEVQFKSIDSLILTSEERLSPHRVGYTKSGRKLRISLPRSTELADGDVLAIDGDVAIVVEAAPEDIFVISPATSLDWGMIGFNLGNLHRPVRFTDTAILTPADPFVADLCNQMGILFERQMIPFVGQRSNIQISEHSH
jgi:urease accessory protein